MVEIILSINLVYLYIDHKISVKKLFFLRTCTSFFVKKAQRNRFKNDCYLKNFYKLPGNKKRLFTLSCSKLSTYEGPVKHLGYLHLSAGNQLLRYGKNAEIRNLLSHSNCNQRNVYNYTEADLPTPLHLQQLSEALQHKLSYNSLNMANAIGLIPTLEKYIQLKAQPKQDAEYRLSILELKQDMDHKINMSSLEISAISSEMDCEEERTSQIANYLSGRADNRESKLTIAAIVVGAAGAILTGGVIKMKPQPMPPASPQVLPRPASVF